MHQFVNTYVDEYETPVKGSLNSVITSAFASPYNILSSVMVSLAFLHVPLLLLTFLSFSTYFLVFHKILLFLFIFLHICTPVSLITLPRIPFSHHLFHSPKSLFSSTSWVCLDWQTHYDIYCWMEPLPSVSLCQ